MPTAQKQIKAEPPTEMLNLRKILVPHDFSLPSRKAFKYGSRLAKTFGARITLLHVIESAVAATLMETPVVSQKDLTSAEKNLRVLLSSAEAAGLKETRFVVRTGIASHEIVEAARELDMDLILIATHGYTGWKRLCVGSTTERVVRTAPCPVLVVREKEHDFV